ncbi:MAG: phage tail tape measure C-terminal domain-containing protein [Bdellovibrionales bacterium]
MTEKNLAIRLSVMDGGKVKAELKDVGDAGQKALQQIEQASQPASKALLAIDAASHNLQGRVQGLAHEMGPLGSALGALGPYGLAAAAGLTVVTLGLEKSIEEAMQAEKSYNRLQAVLTATGQSSGLTARQIVEFSDGIEKSALVTAEQVQDAAAALATFRSVAGDSFTRALRLAQDMSAVFGQDLHSSVVRLGRALEDPVEGLTALRRVGVVFTQGQREVIKSLAETGQTAEAQKVILDALEAKVGGAGAAEASGVTGASHRLAVAWKNMLESIGQTSVVSGGAEIALRGLSATLEGVTDLFKKAPLAERLTETTAELAEAQRVLERLQNYKPRVMTDMTPLLDRQKEKIADLRSEVEALTAETRKEAEAEAQAAAGRAAAEKDHRAELLTDQRKKLDEALDKLVTDPAEKIAKINAELATTKQRLENLREKDNSNVSGVDTAIKEAEDIARRQIEAVEKPALEAAKRASEANAKVVGDLQRQLLGLGNARQAFIDQAVSRLSDQAGDAERMQTRKLAAQLFDQKAFAEAQKVIDDYGRQLDKLKDKRQAAITEAVARLPETATQAQIEHTRELAAALYDQTDAQERFNKLQQEGQKLTLETKGAAESYAEKLAKLKELLDAGAISQNVYNLALEKATQDNLAARKDSEAGALRAFQKYRDEAADSASAVEKAFTSAMKATDDAIVDLVTSGGQSLKSLDDLAKSIVADITRMVVQKSITGPLFDAIGGSIGSGGFFGDLFGSIFHEGGVVGETAPQRQVPSYVFAGAPRYHSGGIAGLMPGEIPAILQRGEVVLPKDAGRASTPVNVVMNISTPDAGSFRASQAQIAAKAARGIRRAGRNL